MLKAYDELVKFDVTPYCDMREAKDDSGKKIKVPYLNWAKCKELLHVHGAKTVYYTPLTNDTGSFVFSSLDTANKDGRETGCYFVAVEVHIDDLSFRMDMPLLNGSLVVYKDTLNQLRIDNCHKRAFVKGVAIHTGLGFSLWTGEKDTETDFEDLSGHNVLLVKKRIEQKMTSIVQKGMEIKDVLSSIGISDKMFSNILKSLDNACVLESELDKLAR